MARVRQAQVGYTPLRISDVPDMDIEFVRSDERPVGLGEPATTVTGPAIGNAIHAAVGVRLRHLPIRSADVLAARAALQKALRTAMGERRWS